MKIFVLSLLPLLAGFVVSSQIDSSITFPKSTDQGMRVANVDAENFSRPHKLGSMRTLAHNVAKLGLKTLRNLLPVHENVIVSPFNVYSCLGILGLGAAGETRNEILGVLGPRNANLSFADLARSTAGLSYASSLFLDRRFEPESEFVESAMAEYEASVVKVDMSKGEETKNLINGWVSDRTNGTIKNLLEESLDSRTKMIVVSTLVLNGKWLRSFSPSETTTGRFNIDGDTFVDVELMHLVARVSVVRNPLLDAVGLPYMDEGMKMYLILPKDRGTEALKKLLSHLNVNSLKKLQRESVEEEVFVTVPKLKIKGQYSLRTPLENLGIESMFDPSKADFTNLAKEESNLFVSEIYHSVHFEVDEEGTLASAATASILTKAGRFIFQATRPFIVVITNEKNLIFFMGAVVNP